MFITKREAKLELESRPLIFGDEKQIEALKFLKELKNKEKVILKKFAYYWHWRSDEEEMAAPDMESAVKALEDDAFDNDIPMDAELEIWEV